MVVDDNQAEAELTVRSLVDGFSGCEVTLLLEPESVLPEIENQQFHAIILDYMLPQVDGLSLLSTIVRLPSPPAVLMLTGHGDEEVAVTAIKRGAADYVSKKPSGEHLLTLQHRLRQTLYNKGIQDQPAASSAFCEGVVGIGADGNICFVNAAAASSIGVGRLDLLGNLLTDILVSTPKGVEREFFRKLYGDILMRGVDQVSRSDFFARGERVSDLNRSGVVAMDDGLVDLIDEALNVTPHAMYAKVNARGDKHVMVEVRMLDGDSPGHTVLPNTYGEAEGEKLLLELLDTLTKRDHLTGVQNRVTCLRDIGEITNRSGTARTGFGVIYVDLDRFGRINAGLGHEAGDRVLQQAGRRLRTAVSGKAQIGHLGAGHFIIYQTESEIVFADFLELATSITGHFEEPLVQGAQALTCTASVVYAWFGRDDLVPYSLIHALEKQCKKIKTQGGNGFAQLTSATGDEVLKHLMLEEALRADLNGPGKGLRLIYSPYVNLNNGRIYGFEALTRWRHPDQGLINTKEVISIAEQSQLILTLGDRVIRGGASHLAAWRTQGCNARLTVNLSARQIASDHINAANILTICAEHGLTASDVDIEVAESSLLGNLEHVGLQLRTLADAGVRVWLDDFEGNVQGVQYFSYLPIYGLKVDVRDFDPNSGDAKQAVKLASSISTAHDHALLVTAVGVETEAQLDFLRAEGCDYAQGWFYTQGLAAGEVAEYAASFPEAD